MLLQNLIKDKIPNFVLFLIVKFDKNFIAKRDKIDPSYYFSCGDTFFP